MLAQSKAPGNLAAPWIGGAYESTNKVKGAYADSAGTGHAAKGQPKVGNIPFVNSPATEWLICNIPLHPPACPTCHRPGCHYQSLAKLGRLVVTVSLPAPLRRQLSMNWLATPCPYGCSSPLTASFTCSGPLSLHWAWRSICVGTRSLWLRTRNPLYYHQCRLLAKLYVLNFGIWRAPRRLR